MYLIGNGIKQSKTCSLIEYRKIFSFVFTCSEKLARNTFKSLIQALRYTKLSDKQMKTDISLLFNQLGKNILILSNSIKTCEFVTFFRQILLDGELPSIVLMDLIQSLKPDTATNEEVCACFAILGGNIEVCKPYETVTIQDDLQNEKLAITTKIAKPESKKFERFFYDLPFNAETIGKKLEKRHILPFPTIPFSPYMFLDFDFILSFYNRCTFDTNSLIGTLYMSSLCAYASHDDFCYSFLSNTKIFSNFLDKTLNTINPFDTIQITYDKLMRVYSLQTAQEKYENFGVIVNKNYPSIVYLSRPIQRTQQFEFVIELKTSEDSFFGFIGLVDDTDDLSFNVNYAIVHLPTGELYPLGKTLNFEKYMASTLRITVNKNQFSINGSPSIALHTNCEYVRLLISPVEDESLKSIITTKGDFSPYLTNVKVTSQKQKEQLISYKPHIIGFTDIDVDQRANSSDFQLINIPDSIKRMNKNDSINFLKNPSGRFGNPKVIEDVRPEWVEKTQMMNFGIPIIPSTSCTYVSLSLKLSYASHLFAQLFSQWSTALLVKLINSNDFILQQKLLPQNTQSRLFSILLIMLEPFSQEDFQSYEFPFSMKGTVLTPFVPTNKINMGLTEACKACITKLSNSKTFVQQLANYTYSLFIKKSVHLMSDPMSPVLYTEKPIDGLISFNSSDRLYTHLMITVPHFNLALENISCNVENMTKHFPLLCASNKVTLSWPENSKKYPLECLCLSKWYTSWALKTPFELLILLRTLYYLNIDQYDPFFIKNCLIDLILSQSPFIWPYAHKFITAFSQNFVKQEKLTLQYIHKVILLNIFVKNHGQSEEIQNINSFFIQEQRGITSDLPKLLSPFFPDFFAKSSSSVSIPGPNDSVNIFIPELSFNPTSNDALSYFLIYSNIIKTKTSINGFPFYEILPLWYALYDKRDPLGISVDPIKIEQTASSMVTIKNPRGLSTKIRISQKHDLDNSVIISCSESPTFDECTVLTRTNLPKDITFTGHQLFISITGSQDASMNMLNISVLESNIKQRGKSVKIYPNQFHDDFVNDMNIFINNWKPEHTRELVLAFPSYMLEQSDFNLLLDGCLQSPLSGQFPPRVVLLVALLIHRLNYMASKFKRVIGENSLKRVSDYLSDSGAINDFVHSIKIISERGPSIKINRRDAHKLVLEGQGDYKKSIICQFSKFVSHVSLKNLRCDPPWSVQFNGEDAIDAGGPRRELFNEISSSIFQPTSKLFILSPNGANHCGQFRDVYVPIPNQKKEFNNQYTSIGHFLGIVMRCGFPQNIPFAPLIWKYLAGENINADDILLIDSKLKDLFNQLKKSSQEDTEEEFQQKFNILWTFISWTGESVVMNNTRNRGVLQKKDVDNYINETIQFRINEIQPSLNLIRDGFYENIGFSSHPLMTASLLSIVAQGSNVITTGQLKALTSMMGFDRNDKGVTNFWAAVERMTNEQRSKLLKFITTLTRLPNPDINRDFHITINKMADGNDSRLPGASTCFNRMYLPSYSTAEIAFQKITYAIEMCDTMENS